MYVNYILIMYFSEVSIAEECRSVFVHDAVRWSVCRSLPVLTFICQCAFVFARMLVQHVVGRFGALSSCCSLWIY